MIDPHMPASSKKSCLAVLRSIAGITQRQLAELVDCAPITIQSIELGKLALSQRMAQRISLQTGVSQAWLLANDYKAAPTTARDPLLPYRKRDYDRTRADITDPRTDPMDLMVADGVWKAAAHTLAGGLLSAYRKDQMVFFYYRLRELLEDIQAEFPPARDLKSEPSIEKMHSQLHQLLGEAATAKKIRAAIGQPPA
jgi:transcriptional regulator with XRE-family HTH domain